MNPFVPSAPFLYPPENVRKTYGFLMFSGGDWVRERGTNEQTQINRRRYCFNEPKLLGYMILAKQTPPQTFLL